MHFWWSSNSPWNISFDGFISERWLDLFFLVFGQKAIISPKVLVKVTYFDRNVQSKYGHIISFTFEDDNNLLTAHSKDRA